LLARPAVRQAAAEAIVAGLQQYFEGEALTASLDRYKGERLLPKATEGRWRE